MTNKISVLIVDSAPKSLEITLELLEANPIVNNIFTAKDSDEALLKCIDTNPDIILLEYPTKGKTQETLIRFIKTKFSDTTLVFVSNSKEHAVHAIQNEVFHYLLKPLSKGKLDKIADQVFTMKQNNLQSRITQLIEQSVGENRLRVQTFNGYLILNPEEIIYCRADRFYTEIHFSQNRMEVCYMLLKNMEELLVPFNFLRVSRANMINLKFIRKIIRKNNTIVLAQNGTEYMIKASKTIARNMSKYDNE